MTAAEAAAYRRRCPDMPVKIIAAAAATIDVTPDFANPLQPFVD